MISRGIMGRNRNSAKIENPHEHRPTRAMRDKVESLLMAGFNNKQIATYLSISPSTFARHYEYEINTTMLDKTSVLTDALYKDAVKGHKASKQLWLKCRAKWAEARPLEEKEQGDKITSLLEELVKQNAPDDQSST